MLHTGWKFHSVFKYSSNAVSFEIMCTCRGDTKVISELYFSIKGGYPTCKSAQI